MNTRTLIALIALSTPMVASAGARKVPTYDLTDDATTLKSAKQMKMTVSGKPKAYPKKVAIGFFNARYLFKETTRDKSQGQTTVTTLRFTDDQYTYLTDEMYAQFKAHLEAEGFEVLPKDAVVNSAAYQALEGEDDVKMNNKRVRYSPSGMKNLKTHRGAPKQAGDMARLNAELGTDAIVSGFVSVGICSMEPTPKTEMRAGVYACIKGDATMPGVRVEFYGGTKGSGEKAKPEWTAGWLKAVEFYEYNKKDDLIYDIAIVSKWAAGRSINRGFWKRAGLGADEQAFVGGSTEIWHDALEMGWELWASKVKGGHARTAAKGPNDIEPPAPPTDSVASKEAATGEVPPLPGAVSCFAGQASVNGSPIGEVLYRRGVADDQAIEDSITVMEGQPPYRYVTTMALNGSNFTATEAAETWTGEGSFTDGFGTWTAQLAMANGMTVSSEGSVEGGKLSIASKTMDPSGKVLADSLTEASEIDAETCEARFGEYAVPSGAF